MAYLIPANWTGVFHVRRGDPALAVVAALTLNLLGFGMLIDVGLLLSPSERVTQGLRDLEFALALVVVSDVFRWFTRLPVDAFCAALLLMSGRVPLRRWGRGVDPLPLAALFVVELLPTAAVVAPRAFVAAMGAVSAWNPVGAGWAVGAGACNAALFCWLPLPRGVVYVVLAGLFEPGRPYPALARAVGLWTLVVAGVCLARWRGVPEQLRSWALNSAWSQLPPWRPSPAPPSPAAQRSLSASWPPSRASPSPSSTSSTL